jgi:hypothetical protein
VNLLRYVRTAKLYEGSKHDSTTLSEPAYFSLRGARGADSANKLLAKLRVYTISDQDDSGAWMRREFPTLFYIVSPGGYGGATWTGIPPGGAGAWA